MKRELGKNIRQMEQSKIKQVKTKDARRLLFPHAREKDFLRNFTVVGSQPIHAVRGRLGVTKKLKYWKM